MTEPTEPMPTEPSEPSVPTVPTVPTELFGCWQRAWIRHADGAIDDTSLVLWLQLPSKMADVRISASQPQLSDRGGFDQCTLDELRALATSESSSGITKCEPVTVGADGIKRSTAEWLTRNADPSDHAVNFQPVTAYPEPGLLQWSQDEKSMTERAPSGAYVEQWNLVDGSQARLIHHHLSDGRQVYIAGPIAILVRDRPKPVWRQARLVDLVAECGNDRSALTSLVDCEFSVARLLDRRWRITSSTLPWRIGDHVDVDHV